MAHGGALVIFPGALGDFVCFEPALAVLRARSEVRILCKASLVSLCENAALGRAEPIEGRPSTWLFSRTPPPEAERFFGGFAAIDCFTGAGVSEVEANLRSWGGGAASAHPFRPTTRIHLAVHFLRSIGSQRAEPPEPQLVFAAEAVAAARAEHSALLNRPSVLVVHPGSGGFGKRWSRSGFRTILERWNRSGGGTVVLLGPAEEGESSYWRATGARVLQSPEWTAMAAILGSAGVYLGNDSGPSHFAAAVGAPGVVLFGPSDPECWRPLSRRMRVIRPEPWASIDEDVREGDVEAIESALFAAIDAASGCRLDNNTPHH